MSSFENRAPTLNSQPDTGSPSQGLQLNQNSNSQSSNTVSLSVPNQSNGVIQQNSADEQFQNASKPALPNRKSNQRSNALKPNNSKGSLASSSKSEYSNKSIGTPALKKRRVRTGWYVL